MKQALRRTQKRASVAERVRVTEGVEGKEGGREGRRCGPAIHVGHRWASDAMPSVRSRVQQHSVAAMPTIRRV
jgi:hypothetical protein